MLYKLSLNVNEKMALLNETSFEKSPSVSRTGGDEEFSKVERRKNNGSSKGSSESKDGFFEKKYREDKNLKPGFEKFTVLEEEEEQTMPKMIFPERNVEKIKESFSNDFSYYFKKSDFIFTVCFLAIYVLLSYLVKFAYQSFNDEHDLTITRIFDILVFIILIITIAVYFSKTSDKKKEADSDKSIDNMVAFVNYKYSPVLALLSILVLYLIIFLFNIPMTFDKRSIFIFLLELVNWITFVICILNLFLNRVFDFSLIDEIAEWLKDLENDSDDEKKTETTKTTTTKVTVNGNTCGNGNISGNGNVCKNEDIKTTTTTDTTTYTVNGSVKKKDEKDRNKEVYNVSNNLYNYEEAQAICKAYGADMATYDQLEDAYEDGAEWCNYGWSANQMIFFPTQKDTWNDLQKNASTKNNCGRPGINGGYMSNPYLKFGVNCYGIKPKPTAEDLAEMKAQREKITAKTGEEKALDDKVEYWKRNASILLNLNSFNKNEWSEHD
jgi:uncharacterized membrane protein (DUF485 family)